MKWRSQIVTSKLEVTKCDLKLDIANCDFKQNTKSGIYNLEITNCDIKI